jgi:carboxypeptidase Q
VTSWQVLSSLRQLNLRPRRTIRLVMWTCEEFGGYGSAQYYQDHKHESDRISLAMESDMGSFTPRGILFSGNTSATSLMKQVVALLAPINATSLSCCGGEADNSPFGQDGVPLGSLNNENERYFYYHHSAGDMMTIYNQQELDLAATAIAVTAFLVRIAYSLIRCCLYFPP